MISQKKLEQLFNEYDGDPEAVFQALGIPDDSEDDEFAEDEGE